MNRYAYAFVKFFSHGILLMLIPGCLSGNGTKHIAVAANGQHVASHREWTIGMYMKPDDLFGWDRISVSGITPYGQLINERSSTVRYRMKPPSVPGPIQLAWSPDSRNIAAIASGKIYIMSARYGGVRQIHGVPPNYDLAEWVWIDENEGIASAYIEEKRMFRDASTKGIAIIHYDVYRDVLNIVFETHSTNATCRLRMVPKVGGLTASSISPSGHYFIYIEEPSSLAFRDPLTSYLHRFAIHNGKESTVVLKALGQIDSLWLNDNGACIALTRKQESRGDWRTVVTFISSEFDQTYDLTEWMEKHIGTTNIGQVQWIDDEQTFLARVGREWWLLNPERNIVYNLSEHVDRQMGIAMTYEFSYLPIANAIGFRSSALQGSAGERFKSISGVLHIDRQPGQRDLSLDQLSVVDQFVRAFFPDGSRGIVWCDRENLFIVREMLPVELLPSGCEGNCEGDGPANNK